MARITSALWQQTVKVGRSRIVADPGVERTQARLSLRIRPSHHAPGPDDAARLDSAVLDEEVVRRNDALHRLLSAGGRM